MENVKNSVERVREALGEEGLEAVLRQRDKAEEAYMNLPEGAKAAYELTAELIKTLLQFEGVDVPAILAGMELIVQQLKSSEELTKQYMKEQV